MENSSTCGKNLYGHPVGVYIIEIFKLAMILLTKVKTPPAPAEWMNTINCNDLLI
jgi:hypothetical protein